MNINVDPDWGAPRSGSTTSSDHGTGPLGFTGTVRKRALAATGLATLDDDFGGGPVMPMVPATWNAGQSVEAGQGGEHD